MRHDESVALTGAPNQRLPVLEITTRSYAFLWQEWRILALPVILYSTLSMAIDLLTPPGGSALLLAFLVLSAVLLAGFEVGLYFRILRNERLSSLQLLRVTKGLGAYAVAAIELWLCMGAAILILMLPAYLALLALAETNIDVTVISELVTLAIGAIALLFIVRLVLIVPGQVIGETISLRQSWHATRGHWMALLALFTLTIGPFIVIPLVLAPYFLSVASVLLLLSMPVRTVALALSYQFLTEPAVSEASAVP